MHACRNESPSGPVEAGAHVGAGLDGGQEALEPAGVERAVGVGGGDDVVGGGGDRDVAPARDVRALLRDRP